MLGKNPIRPPINSDGEILEVKNIFTTIQGEGPYAGTPAVFVRLGGCNLACEFCDTDFENFNNMNVNEIVKKVEELAYKNNKLPFNFIVITGGEPFRQPLEKLCEELIKKNFKIQIETNGTLYRPVNDNVDIICSPKNQGNGYFRIREDLLKRLNALKFVVAEGHTEYSEVADVGQGDYRIPVYVQPMDEGDTEKNKKNLEFAKEIAMKNGYKLSIQMHKLFGMP